MIQYLISEHENPDNDIEINIAITTDHKYFSKIKKWALGQQIILTVHNGTELLSKVFLLMDLIKTDSPFDDEKTGSFTGQKLGLFSNVHLIIVCF